jgi:predicted methyltransferase MtxX (methanogen marker protein 4)
LQNASVVSGSNGEEAKPVVNQSDSVSSSKLEDVKRELEEQRDLANARLIELEQLNKEHKVIHFLILINSSIE